MVDGPDAGALVVEDEDPPPQALAATMASAVATMAAERDRRCMTTS